MSAPPRTRILLADGHPGSRALARRLLGEHWDVAGEAATGDELLAAAPQLRPDVIVLDMGLSAPDGRALPQRLREAGIPSRLVLLSLWDDSEYAEEATRLGADALVAKDRLATGLVAAVRSTIARLAEGTPIEPAKRGGPGR